MRNICIITEDICSLAEDQIKEFGIELVRTKLYFPPLEKFPGGNIYHLMKETKEIPKTAAPSPGSYLNAYKKLERLYDKILVITVGKRLSGCYNSALEASNMVGSSSEIYVFDSSQAIAGQGLLILRAIELIKNGKEINEILRILEDEKQKIVLICLLRKISWAEKTGRIKREVVRFFNLLKFFGVHPFLGIKNGRVGFVGFNFWIRNDYEALFREIKKKIDPKRGLGINYTDNREEAVRLKEKIENEIKTKVLFVTPVPIIVGVNTGPGALFVAFFKKNDEKRSNYWYRR